MRHLFLVTFLFSSAIAHAAEAGDNVVGSWSAGNYVKVLNPDGSFYASGYETEDDSYGTYEVHGGNIDFTYAIYDTLIRSSYRFVFEDGSLVLFDELGYTLMYAKD